MCTSGSAPSPPARLPEAPTPAPAPGQAAGAASREELAKRRAGTRGGTLLTGSRGLTDAASTGQKTLLGE